MIKKGCVARCKAGMLGLVTSDEPQMTRYGKLAWIGVQLSPDKAGQEWTSTDPEFVYSCVAHLLEDYKEYFQYDMQTSDELYKECVNRGLINEAEEEALAKAGADFAYSFFDLVDFLRLNKGPKYQL